MVAIVLFKKVLPIRNVAVYHDLSSTQRSQKISGVYSNGYASNEFKGRNTIADFLPVKNNTIKHKKFLFFIKINL